jgi:hypothetical protein
MSSHLLSVFTRFLHQFADSKVIFGPIFLAIKKNLSSNAIKPDSRKFLLLVLGELLDVAPSTITGNRYQNISNLAKEENKSNFYKNSHEIESSWPFIFFKCLFLLPSNTITKIQQIKSWDDLLFSLFLKYTQDPLHSLYDNQLTKQIESYLEDYVTQKKIQLSNDLLFKLQQFFPQLFVKIKQ